MEGKTLFNWYSINTAWKDLDAYFLGSEPHQLDPPEGIKMHLTELPRKEVLEVYDFLQTPSEDLSSQAVDKWYGWLVAKFRESVVPLWTPGGPLPLRGGTSARRSPIVRRSRPPPEVPTFLLSADSPSGGFVWAQIPRWYLGRMEAVVSLRQDHPDLTVEEVIAVILGRIPPKTLAYLPEFLSVLDGSFGGRHHRQHPMWSIGAYAIGEYFGLTLPESYSVLGELGEYQDAEYRVGDVYLRSPRVRYCPIIDWSIEVPEEVIPEPLRDKHPAVEFLWPS